MIVAPIGAETPCRFTTNRRPVAAATSKVDIFIRPIGIKFQKFRYHQINDRDQRLRANIVASIKRVCWRDGSYPVIHCRFDHQKSGGHGKLNLPHRYTMKHLPHSR
jgi:hypothetical protein